jgi:hypothetical protein
MLRRRYLYLIALLAAAGMLSGMAHSGRPDTAPSWLREAIVQTFQCPFLKAPECVEPLEGL